VTANLIDLTRLVSRMGRGAPTGIDRVELAYLDHFLMGNDPLFGIVQTKLGYLLLDSAGCRALAGLYHGQGELPQPTVWTRRILRDPMRYAALQWVRRRAIARRPAGLIAGLLRKLSHGCTYWNLGHANLSADTLTGMAQAGIKIAVLIHDTIPLDHPEYCRPDQIAPFAQKIAATARYADLVIHTTQDARTKTEAHFAKLGRIPFGVTANLGLTLAPAHPMPQTRPYFVALGTIEPRKNYALLFDIWEKHANFPPLHVIGAKGWAEPALFAQMDRLIARDLVIHHANLDDARSMGLLAGAQALLFPSLAEGYGLPPLEAASLGLPVIANDLPVLREVLGDLAVYLDATDGYSWAKEIVAFHDKKGATKNEFRPPKWSQHFKTVLAALSNTERIL
jgi:glycosyltransferase involved in cell wall biosynthesis